MNTTDATPDQPIEENQLIDHLTQKHPFTLFPDIDFASTVFSALQHFLDNGIHITNDDLKVLLRNMENLAFGDNPTLDEVSHTLEMCVKDFLQPLVSRRTGQQMGDVVHHELKRAPDGVFRLFPPGHRFENEK